MELDNGPVGVGFACAQFTVDPTSTSRKANENLYNQYVALTTQLDILVLERHPTLKSFVSFEACIANITAVIPKKSEFADPELELYADLFDEFGIDALCKESYIALIRNIEENIDLKEKEN